MAILTSYTQLGGVVGDTFGTKKVTRVISDGVYVFADIEAAVQTVYIVESSIDFGAAEPAVPVLNSIYIASDNSTSNVTSTVITQNYLYKWNGTAWIEIVPSEGWIAYNKATDSIYTFNGSAWVEVSASVLFAGLIDSSGSTQTVTLPAATGSGTINIYVNSAITNTATLAVTSGDQLNTIVDGTFLFSNYPAGTEFEVLDYAAGKWVVSVVGASISTALARYSIRGVVDNFDTVNGANILPIGSLVTSDLSSSGQHQANEYDPLGWRTANQITVSKTGRYRVDLNVVHTASALVGANAQATSGSSRSGIRINGTSIEWLGIDDSSGLADQTSGFIIRQFTAGDEIDVVVNATSAETSEDFYVSFAMEELPSTETILAGHVVPTALNSWYGYEASPTGASLQSFAAVNNTNLNVLRTAVDLSTPNATNTSGLSAPTVSGSTITIPAAGKYRIQANVSYKTSSTGGEEAALQVGVNGSYVTHTTTTSHSDNSTRPIQIDIDYRRQFNAGDTVTLYLGSDSSAGGQFDIVSWQVAVDEMVTATVVNPDTVPVTDLTWGQNAWAAQGTMTTGPVSTAVTGSSSRQTIAPVGQRLSLTGTGAGAGVFTGSGVTRDTTNNQLVITSAGRYHVSFDITGGLSAASEHGVQLIKNGSVLLSSDYGYSNPFNCQDGNWEGELAIGDTLELRAWSNLSGTFYLDGGTFIVAQQPSHSIVKYNPGDVEVQNLHYGSISGASSFPATANFVFPVSAWTTNGASFGLTVSEAAGTITIAQAGTYRVVASAMARSVSSNAANSVAIAKNGVVVYTSPEYLAGNAGTYPLPMRAEEVLTLAAGDVITAFAGPTLSTTAWGTPYLSVSQEPVGMFVNPGSVPVTALHYGHFQNDSAIGANTDLTLGTSNGVSGLTVGATSVTITQSGLYKLSASVIGTVNANFLVKIRVNGVDTIIGSGLQNAVTGSTQVRASGALTLTAGQVITVQSTNGSNRNFVLDVEQKSLHSVIQPGATAVNDQAASGYIDIGNMRMQWGRNTGAGNLIVTLPALFANANYVVTASSDGLLVGDTGSDTRTTSTFRIVSKNVVNSAGSDASGTFSWIAIGLKP